MNFTSKRPKENDTWTTSPIFVAAQIKDDPIVAHEVDGAIKLPLYLGRICPMRFGCNREPRTNWALSMRVTRPEFLQRPTGDYLH